MVSENWGKQKSREGPPLRQRLEKMGMGELRKFAKKNKLKASDTSKSELIEEIIKEMEENNG